MIPQRSPFCFLRRCAAIAAIILIVSAAEAEQQKETGKSEQPSTTAQTKQTAAAGTVAGEAVVKTEEEEEPELSPAAIDDQTMEKFNRFHEGLLELEGDIAVHQGEINEEKRKEGRLLRQISQLDKELNSHQQKLNKLLDNSERQKETIVKQNEELDILRERRDEVMKHFQKRSSAFYMLGNIGLFNAVFSRHTLPELLTFRSAFDELIKYDKKVLQAYSSTLDLQERGRNALKLESKVMQDFVLMAEAERQKVEIAREKLEKKLAQVKGERSMRKQAIKELREISKDLAQSMAEVKDEFLKNQKVFKESKGTLPMPVDDGLIITRFHHMRKSEFGDKTRCDGIEIDVPDRSEVHAIGGGKIIYSGYLEGYGNTVIINHGMHYYTVTSRLEEVFAKVGSRIEQNETIGLSGATATLFTNGIYLEVRHKQRQQDPLSWIDRKFVRFK